MASAMNGQSGERFWETLTLSEMTTSQWESLCDGCGKCCLHKLEDEDSGELLFTAVACQLLDCESARCRDYENRLKRVPDCVDIRAHDLDSLIYMPDTCAYRLLHEGKRLPEWHPLVTGDSETVHRAQMSVRNRAISELDVSEEDWDLYLIEDLS